MVLGSFKMQTYASNNLEPRECKCSVFLRTGKRLNTIVYKGWLGSKHQRVFRPDFEGTTCACFSCLVIHENQRPNTRKVQKDAYLKPSTV